MKVKNIVIIAAILLLQAMVISAQEDEEAQEEIIDRPGMGPGAQMGPGGQMGPGMGQMMYKKKIGKKQFGHEGMRWMEGFDVPDQIEAKVMEVIKKNDPVFADKLIKLKENEPKKYEVTIGIAAKFLNMARQAEDPSLEKDVVRGISLEYEVRELSLQYEKANETEKAKIKEKIKANLNELFDIRTKGQEIRIKRMSEEIAKLKANLEKRKANKAKIVEQRLNQLTGEKDLSW